jgi:hypothetical protein
VGNARDFASTSAGNAQAGAAKRHRQRFVKYFTITSPSQVQLAGQAGLSLQESSALMLPTATLAMNDLAE